MDAWQGLGVVAATACCVVLWCGPAEAWTVSDTGTELRVVAADGEVNHLSAVQVAGDVDENALDHLRSKEETLDYPANFFVGNQVALAQQFGHATPNGLKNSTVYFHVTRSSDGTLIKVQYWFSSRTTIS